MKKLLVLIALLTFLSHHEAAADNVILHGDTLRTIFFSPFDSYPGIVKLRERLQGYGSQCTEDNCSFLSTWKIIGGRLTLVKIQNCDCNEKKQKANLQRLFSDQLKDGVLRANWFTGEIWVTKDKPNSWSGLFAASWPRETRLVVKNGVVSSVKEFVYPKLVITEYFKNMDSLYQFIYTHLDWSKLHHLPTQSARLYFRFDQDTAGYLIHLKQDTMLRPSAILDAAEVAEIGRVMGLLQWPLYYHHGRPVTPFNGVDIMLGEDIRQKYLKPD